MWGSHKPNRSTWTGHIHRHVDRLLGSHALQDGICTPSCHLDDLEDPLLFSTRDHIGCPKLASQREALRLMSQDDDAFGSQSKCCQRGTEANRAIPDHRHRSSWAHPRGDGGVVARCHVIGQRKEGFEEGFISFHGGWNRHQRCVCEASANRLGLSTLVPIAPDTPLQAGGIKSFATEFTGAITEVIGGDNKVSALECTYLRTNIFNNAYPFM